MEAGAVVDGDHGTQLTLPKNALVDGTGALVTGTADVSLTPLDTPSMPFAFPSEIEAVDEDQNRVALASFGVVEVAISKDGQRLDLAEGVRATLDIPIYAKQSATGKTLELGGSIPLWPLDEATGVWIQEGEGTIVEGSSRAGLALRSSLGHLSWWNCDEQFPIRKIFVKFFRTDTVRHSCRRHRRTAALGSISISAPRRLRSASPEEVAPSP